MYRRRSPRPPFLAQIAYSSGTADLEISSDWWSDY
jgi:hypothetical protein